MLSDRRLYLDKSESRIVEEGDPAAFTLLVGAGCEFPEPLMKRLGLKPPGPTPQADADAEKLADERESEAARKADADAEKPKS